MAKYLYPVQVGIIDLDDYIRIEELVAVALSVLDGNQCKEYGILKEGMPDVYSILPTLEYTYNRGWLDCHSSEDKLEEFIKQPLKLGEDE